MITNDQRKVAEEIKKTRLDLGLFSLVFRFGAAASSAEAFTVKRSGEGPHSGGLIAVLTLTDRPDRFVLLCGPFIVLGSLVDCLQAAEEWCIKHHKPKLAW